MSWQEDTKVVLNFWFVCVGVTGAGGKTWCMGRHKTAKVVLHFWCVCVGGEHVVYGVMQECSLFCLLLFCAVVASENVHSLLRNFAKYRLCPRRIVGCTPKWEHIKLSIQQ